MLRAVSIAAVLMGLGLVAWQIIGSFNGTAPLKLDKISWLSSQPVHQPAPPPSAQAVSFAEAMAARKLDLPLPTSTTQILNSSRDYKRPELPGKPGTEDSDMLALYRGYYEAGPEEFLKFELSNTPPRVIKMEVEEGKFKEFHSKTADFEMYNFNGDPYSLIFELEPSKKLYVKFKSKPVRTMYGYLLDWGKPKRVAMIEPDEQPWPPLDPCKQRLPPEL